MKKTNVVQATGKRKTAIAKATLKPGKGIIRINSQLLETLDSDFVKMRIKEPLILSGEDATKVDIKVTVAGGGWQGQAEAARLAIGRALVGFNKKLKKTFHDYDKHLLVADVRRKEVCKPNDSKARAMRQSSKR